METPAPHTVLTKKKKIFLRFLGFNCIFKGLHLEAFVAYYPLPPWGYVRKVFTPPLRHSNSPNHDVSSSVSLMTSSSISCGMAKEERETPNPVVIIPRLAATAARIYTHSDQ